MTENLSGSQLDLVIHGEGDPFAPGHSTHNKSQQDLNELNKMFIESEKGRSNKKQTIRVDDLENGETETSTL